MDLVRHLVAKYFERSGSKYAFLKEARRSVIFGRHNLLHDAPISRSFVNKYSPCSAARSASRSCTSTRSAVRPTAAASGLPPNVLP